MSSGPLQEFHLEIEAFSAPKEQTGKLKKVLVLTDLKLSFEEVRVSRWLVSILSLETTMSVAPPSPPRVVMIHVGFPFDHQRSTQGSQYTNHFLITCQERKKRNMPVHCVLTMMSTTNF